MEPPSSFDLRIAGVLCLSSRQKDGGGVLELTSSALTWTSVSPDCPPEVRPIAGIKSTFLSKREKGRAMLKISFTDAPDIVLEFVSTSADPEQPWTDRDTTRAKLHSSQHASQSVGGTSLAAEPSARPTGEAASGGGGGGGGAAAAGAAVPHAPDAARAVPSLPSQAVSDAAIASASAQARGLTGAMAAAEELRVRRQLCLQRDPPLRRLYEELVVTGIVPEPDFWAQHSIDEVRHATATQRDGPVSHRPSADEEIDLRKKELRIKLTPALITQIFFDHPKVRELYERFVPHKWTEQQFWQRYFRQRHFHSSQAQAAASGGGGGGGGGGARGGADDRDADAQELLRTVRDGAEADESADAPKAEDERRLRLKLAARVNPAHDLRLNEGEQADVQALGDGSTGLKGALAQSQAAGGFGLVSWTDTLAHAGEARSSRASFRQAILPYQKHSERVMAHVAAAAARNTGESPGGPDGGLTGPEPDEAELAMRLRKRSLAESTLDPDLVAEPEEAFQRLPQVSKRPHAMVQPGAEPRGTTSPRLTPSRPPPQQAPPVEGQSALELLSAELASWALPELLPPAAAEAHAVLREIRFEQGAAARGGAGLAALPAQLRLEEYTARVHELLRHFWGCLNPRTDATDDKLARLSVPLRRAFDELHALRAALPADERKPLVAAAITPLIAMIERTFTLAAQYTSAR